MVDNVQNGLVHQWPTVTICGNDNFKGASKTSGDGIETAIKKYYVAQYQQQFGQTESHVKNMDQLGSYDTSLVQVKVEPNGETSYTFHGRMNLDWAEWLMGWPIGWTRLDPLSDDLILPWWNKGWWKNGTHAHICVKKKTQKHRTRRLRCIGNGQVPICAAFAFTQLYESLKRNNP